MDMHLNTERADHRDDALVFDRVPRADRLPYAFAPAARIAPPQPATIGSGWYHDAAIAAERQDKIDARSNPYRH